MPSQTSGIERPEVQLSLDLQDSAQFIMDFDAPISTKCCEVEKTRCQLCGEFFCVMCDSNHIEACRDRNRP